MTYTYEQVREASLAYFNGDDLAAEAFAGKYALQDLSGVFYEKTPADMHVRLAKEFHRIESKYPDPLSYEEILEMLSTWKVVPQGSPMSGIGNPFQVQSLSNCFVIESSEDSYGGIFRADQEQAQIMKRRGGVGQDISCIRPKGLHANNAARSTDGIEVFMDRFSNTTREVAQNGRRGALMISLSVHHPQIADFIDIKKDRKRVTGANLSSRITDEFMRAVKSSLDYEQRWPVVGPKKVSKFVSAVDIWNKITQAAWESAEPGVLFWDTIIRGSPADCYADVGYETISTNPCGELPLPKYDSCRLILLNLIKFVKNAYTNKAYFCWHTFANYAYKAQRLMDDLIDLELEMIDRILAKIASDPESDEVKRTERLLWEKIKKVTADARRTGLGITALGDTLAALGLKYGSDASIEVTEMIYKDLAVASYQSSVIMAKERGAFPVFDLEKEKDHEFIKKVIAQAGPAIPGLYLKHGRRNIANLTTSPAGTVSVETQTTSGIECAFLIDYMRRRKINPGDKMARVDFIDPSGDKWQEYKVYHHGHLEWARVNGKDPELDKKESPYFGATSADVDWVKKISLQAAAQRWVDHSISNTTNVPNDTPIEVVREIYMKGWELGCKGVTIYRDGSRTGVMMATTPAKEKGISVASSPLRPTELPCDIHHVRIKNKPHIMLVGLMEGKPYEIFFGEKAELSADLRDSSIKALNAKKGKIGKYKDITERSIYNLHVGDVQLCDIVESFANPNYGAFTRTISTALRYGVPVQEIVEQLRKDKESDMMSFSSVVARVLAKNYIADGTKIDNKEKCSECGSTSLAYQQGCSTCLDCGSSKCS